MSLAATFIAGCALIATLWQAHLSRTHNRLTVRPIMVMERQREVTDTGIELIYHLKNHGIGPAIIEDRFFVLNGHRFEAATVSGDEILELSEVLLKDKIYYFLREHGLPGKKTTIPQNGGHVIARIYFPNVATQQLDSTLAHLGEVQFSLKYKSLYGTPFELIESL